MPDVKLPSLRIIPCDSATEGMIVGAGLDHLQIILAWLLGEHLAHA
jgi:hypothetical protein